MTNNREKSGVLTINGSDLSPEKISQAIKFNYKLSVSETARNEVKKSHELLIEFIEEGRIIYGVNTGMGGFVNWLIPDNMAQKLQENLIEAVATNVGNFLDDRYVRAAMIIRINSLACGCSAISLQNFNKLVDLYNAGVVPCIPEKGSLGASGDLGPLACIALVCIGRWKARYKGKVMPGIEALKQASLTPMTLSYKEGLSLINGTSAMTGLASELIVDAKNLLKTYDAVSSLVFESLQVKSKPFNPIVHTKKHHSGQVITAQNIWKFLSDSKLVVDENELGKSLQKLKTKELTYEDSSIEDAYSIRCTPQIVGPVRDIIKFVHNVITNEINSVSDNPLVLPDQNDVFHNGHFHGQYISMSMDQLSIALTTLCNLSDRRIDRFMDKNHSNGLPPFLCSSQPGLRFGLMGGQFMATSITAENRSLCNPLSIQTLTSTGDFQDIVSMGLIAARRAREIFDNTTKVIAFELLCAAQAADILGITKLSKCGSFLHQLVREVVPFLDQDLCITEYVEQLALSIADGSLLKKLEKSIGEINF